MTRLRKYVRMARQRRLNFWQARWRTEELEEDDDLESRSRSFDAQAQRPADHTDEARLEDDEDDAS
jgi:hypothetical protein